MTTATSAIVTPAQQVADTANRLALQRGAIQASSYEYVGHVWKIVLADTKDTARPGRNVTDMLGLCLDFYQEANKGRPIGPRIAKDKTAGSLLLLDPIRKPDGKVGLPDIPDPMWTPPIHIPTKLEMEGKVPAYVPPKAPMIAQELVDRARGMFPPGTREYLAFGPVEQILILPDGLQETWMTHCTSDINGRHMDLLISVKTGEAFLVNGQYQISRYR